MSLDVYVCKNEINYPSDWRFALEDDGYYWFLWPLIEKLHQLTGEMIDLYGGAEFAGERLADLERFVQEARELIVHQPKRWRVHVAMNYPPEHSKGLKEVTRAGFAVLLEQFQNVLDEAYLTNSSVIFAGD